MPVGRRYKVTCGICGSTFNKDYTSKHCRTSHPSYNIETLPTTVCKDSNQPTISGLFLSTAKEQDNKTSPSPPKDSESLKKEYQDQHVVMGEKEPETPQIDEMLSAHECHSQLKNVTECDMVESHSNEDLTDDIHVHHQTDETFLVNSYSDTETSTDDTATSEEDTECWITCYGKLKHLTSTISECQELFLAADNADAPNQKHLLGNLVDIVQRINDQSSSILKMAVIELTKLEATSDEEKNTSKNNVDYSPVDRDPAKRQEITSDADRIWLIEQGPFQPKLARYPRNVNIEKNKQCSFSSEWFKQYPYLEYSLESNKAYCFVCQLFPQSDSKAAWIKGGLNTWDKMKSVGLKKKGKLAAHFSSGSHKAAMQQLANFVDPTGHIDLMMDKTCRKEMVEIAAETERNREAIKIMLDITRTLARQGLALRGSSEENEENSNFNQFVKLLSRHVPSFKRWLDDAPKRPHTAKYLSPKSQNEYIKLLAADISNRVTEAVNKSEIWSVIADTTPDVSHRDQLAVVARYVDLDSNLPVERLVDIKDVKDKTGDGQAQEIVASVDRKLLDKDSIAFQSYDFTSSMSGVFKRCQAMLKNHLERNIPYIPCTAHRINTTVEHSCEASAPVCALFDILQELFVFITSSPKRFDVYRDKMKQTDEELLMLRNLSATRWVAREESIRAVWSSYGVILEVLGILNGSMYDMKTRVKATALQEKIKSFNFVVMLMFMKNVMGKTKCLTTEVQGIDINIIDTVESFKATITTLEHIRNDSDGLDNQIQAAKIVAEEHHIDPDAEYDQHHRQRKKPRRIDDHSETAAKLSLVNHYRKEFIAVLDAQINALKTNMEAITNIIEPAMTLLQPPYHGPVNIDQLEQLCNMFPLPMRPDIDALETELTTFRCHVLKNHLEIRSVNDALTYLKSKTESLFPLTRRCFRLLLTIPITSASAERSFSKLKLVKTFMRSVMNQDCLGELLALACERDLTDIIDLDIIAERWSRLTKRGRLIKI